MGLHLAVATNRPAPALTIRGLCNAGKDEMTAHSLDPPLPLCMYRDDPQTHAQHRKVSHERKQRRSSVF